MDKRLEGLTHYPADWGVIAAKGAIDMGYRWASGALTRREQHSQWLLVDGDPDRAFPTGGAWRNVQVSVWKLEGLPIADIDPFAWPPVPGARAWTPTKFQEEARG